MRNKITTKDLIKQRFTPKEAVEIEREIQEEVKKHRGGARQGAGRKPKKDNVLEFQIRVTEKEKAFLRYAREHKLDYDELMRG